MNTEFYLKQLELRKELYIELLNTELDVRECVMIVDRVLPLMINYEDITIPHPKPF